MSSFEKGWTTFCSRLTIGTRHERVLLDVVHAPAPREERLDLALAAVLGTGAHASLPHPAHEEIDMGRPEGCHGVRQAKLAPALWNWRSVSA